MNLPKENNPSPNAPDDLRATPDHLLTKVALGLALLTFLIYLPVVGYTFVSYDDDIFVTNNQMVAPGFTWAGVKWAFTSADIDYWRPLSWLSHMLDMEMFGPVGGLHHLSNLLIHIAASVMLLVALHRLTQALWPSAAVAALFAWHPLHVESVAWIAERKDVLCGFFWFYTLWAYAGYVKKPTSRRYLQVLLGFVLGAMSKPMIMTLPFVLLLLDFWPLRRSELGALADLGKLDWHASLRNVWAVVKDKIPLFAIVLVLGLSTVTAQHQVGAVASVPLEHRLVNAVSAYVTYLAQTFWPADLSVIYVFRHSIPVWDWAGSLLLCLSLTSVFLFLARRCSFLIVGWLWFLGVLFPVLGVVRQVGEQGHADRYTYVPSVGVFLILVWSLYLWAANGVLRRRLLVGTLGTSLLLCAIVTRRQLAHWEDGVTLFTQAVKVDPTNTTALNNLAGELISNNKPEAAIPYLEQSLKCKSSGGALWNMALCMLGRGEFDLAQDLTSQAFSAPSEDNYQNQILERLRTYVKISSANPNPLPQERQAASIGEVLCTNEGVMRKLLAAALAARKDFSGAIEQLTHVIRLHPDDVRVQIDRATFLAVLGKDDEAIAQLRNAVAAAPTNSIALSNLGALLAKRGHFQAAFPFYNAALTIDPNNPDTRHNFAIALARNGQPLEAKRQFEAVLELKSNHLPATQQLAWLLTTNAQNRDFRRALTLAVTSVGQSRTASSLDTLAAVLAANHDFKGAIAVASEALELARREKVGRLEDAIRFRLEAYRNGHGSTE